MHRRQGRYWIGTIPRDQWEPWTINTLPTQISYVRGQREVGSQTGYEHWQLLVCLNKKGSLSTIKGLFQDQGHWELTRSEAADDYVWKEDTRVDGSQFEIGSIKLIRN